MAEKVGTKKTYPRFPLFRMHLLLLLYIFTV